MEGIRKNEKEKNSIYIDVKNKMGVELGDRERIKMKLEVSKVVEIKKVEKFNDIVFKILWFEDGIDNMKEEVKELMRMENKIKKIEKDVI